MTARPTAPAAHATPATPAAPRRARRATATNRGSGRAAAPTALPPTDPEEAARFAGLRYVSDTRPGIRRERAGRGFTYRSPTGERITDPDRLRWIRAIVIPPAWTDVWISPVQNGHILATGRDARGRKQYRYHPRWREVRDDTKFGRLIGFGELLPRIRSRVDHDLGQPGLSREKVVAALVRLLELTFIRVGNEEYARLNQSFGLTTLRNRHAQVEGTRIRFRFRGKSGKVHEVGLRDRRLAAVIRKTQELPGQELFECVDHGEAVHAVSSEDVNAYLREITGADVTAKEFRTWAGTVLAFRALSMLPAAGTETEAKREIVVAVRSVAARLGNTPAVARRSYIDPAVLEAYAEGALAAATTLVSPPNAEAPLGDHLEEPPPAPTPDEEAAVLSLLRQRLLAAARSNHAARTTAA